MIISRHSLLGMLVSAPVVAQVTPARPALTTPQISKPMLDAALRPEDRGLFHVGDHITITTTTTDPSQEMWYFITQVVP